jgi:hypothetical protein
LLGRCLGNVEPKKLIALKILAAINKKGKIKLVVFLFSYRFLTIRIMAIAAMATAIMIATPTPRIIIV